MKTILITAFQAVAVKNILRTKVITSLLETDSVRIICLVRYPERVEYYKKELPYAHTKYVAFSGIPHGVYEKIFSFLKFQTIKTRTTDLKRFAHAKDTKNYVSYWLGLCFNRLFAHRLLRRFLRFLDFHLVKNQESDNILKIYRPDIVVLTHLFDDTEISILRSAKKRSNVKTIGFVNSWDKLTARSSIRILPDKILVYNEITKQEAMLHADISEKNIDIIGIPQYDQYFSEQFQTREDFCKQLGLNVSKEIILFAPIGMTYSDFDLEMIDMLHAVIDEKKLIPNAQLLVRFQPNDFFDERKLEKRPWLLYDRPGLRYGSVRGGDWDMTFRDLEHLKNTLHHTSLLISYASSLAVDAAILNKPVININFELQKSGKFSKSPTLYYRTEHYNKALSSGGIRLVGTIEELISSSLQYLKNPLLHSSERAHLVKEQCHFTDGSSGKRMANSILN
ncbi:MAG: hypothetical protein A2928_00125 [Candidatus Taylorbacteria bacterium RIFCSPLOWO2_01_FULL_45_15b]|uniref:Diacylglycerol glucosyltransferase N-terminal domain-containing protein n=1 Tax=Candidatus Taylorbacteria bacterium RIFCSPLOWO2_01_FULL_45_15b TaxID=1802319 RepID=A0A1G2N8J3_9BACT|nr:MAG: hypothetical protein A2928_00125 [Candidatus Taylorbacteria bacterium RIFCSPLOWO2_01_FULL_45_15b]